MFLSSTDKHLFLHDQAHLAQPGAPRVVLQGVRHETQLPPHGRANAAEDP